jgi:hypothetical protein
VKLTVDIFLWSAVYFSAVYAAARYGGKLGQRKLVKVLFLPGVALYAACRSLGCLISMAPVDKIEFVRDREPFLRVGATRIPYFGHLLSAVFTHLPLILLFFYVHGALPVADWDALGLPSIARLRADPALFLTYLSRLGEGLPLSTGAVWLAWYLFLGAAVSSDLRLPEFLAMIVVTIVGCWIAGILSWLGVGFSFFSRGWFMSYWYIPEWVGIASVYATLALLASVAVILVNAALTKVLPKLVPAQGKGGGSGGKSGSRSRSRQSSKA